VVERHGRDANLLIGSVLVPEAAIPKVSMEDMKKSIRPGSVVVDINIDQGGCFKMLRPTSHADLVYTEHGVIHYCVNNINATMPYTLKLANIGWREAQQSDPRFVEGLDVHAGKVTYQSVAYAVGID
tara:strand:+ start:124 stop:504 length:381 start_codon:yes stop_codon:yes gene_type:complete